jgi:KipI family sensor histidine kinase inhibitor
VKILPMGPAAVLVDEVDDPPGWAAAFARIRPAGVVDVVPSARTVLVVAGDERALAAAVAVFGDVCVDPIGSDFNPHVDIEVEYDGPDLAEVAITARMTVDEVVRRHTAATFRVAFCGFAPGFAYLTGLPPELHLPRRPTPRTRVPAGSVAIASEYSAVYPTESPGGWHLLGSTRLELFDVERDPPALLTPGTTVRFAAS